MKKFTLLLVLLIGFTTIFAQSQGDQAGIIWKKRNATGKVQITPGANSDIKFNDSTILRYHNGQIQFWINGTKKYTFSASGTTVQTLTIGTVPLATTLAAKVDTGRTVKRVIGIAGAKVGTTAGWVVAAANNLSLSTLPASQTNSTLVIPITYALKVGSRITGFSIIGQVESAGNTATITADLRKQTSVAADVADASVGAMAAPASLTADAVLSSANAAKTGLTETVGENETFYILITGTTAAATDIAIQGIVLNLSE